MAAGNRSLTSSRSGDESEFPNSRRKLDEAIFRLPEIFCHPSLLEPAQSQGVGCDPSFSAPNCFIDKSKTRH